MLKTFVLMAEYNEWMNAKVYAAAAELPVAEIIADRGAFFGSILRTLNHIAVGDRIWMSRFAAHPSKPAALDALRAWRVPASLDALLFEDLAQLRAHRAVLDRMIRQWTESLNDADLAAELRYTSLKGAAAVKPFADVLLHLFNHQTHHRGQVTTLLHQLGKDVGVTDLLALIPDVQTDHRSQRT